MNLSSLMNEDLIFLDMSFGSYDQIITFISEKLSSQTSLPVEQIHDMLLRRERIGNTFVGHRLALPHSYVDNISDIIVLFIRLKNELKVNIDNRTTTIKYVFAIITSKNKAQLYLKLLSSIAQLVSQSAYVLDNAITPNELLETLDHQEVAIDEELVAKDLICCNVVVKQTDSVSHAVDIMRQYNITFLPVADENRKLIGLIDLADLMSIALEGTKIDPSSIHVLRDMGTTKEIFYEALKHFWKNEETKKIKDVQKDCEGCTVSETASYVEVMFLMSKHRYRYLVVLDSENHVQGVIDTGEMVHRIIRP